jgi:hypothetical protein
MRLRVRFRFDAATGEVQTFLVEDIDQRAPAADHDARHDRLAAEVGRVIERHARVEQLPAGTEVPPETVPAYPDTEPEAESRDEAPSRPEGRTLRDYGG